MLLREQVALVTGASRGIGREVALLLAVEGAQLGRALDHRQQAQAVAGHVGVCFVDDADPAGRCKLVHEQQAGIFQFRLRKKQIVGVEVNQLREKQVNQQFGFGQLVSRNADIDRHALLAHVPNVEVVRGRGGNSVTMPVAFFAPGVFEKYLAGKLAKIEGIGNGDMNWSLQAKKG